MKQKVIVVLIPTANPSIPCIIKSDETDNLGITDSYGLSDIGKSFTPMNMYILDPTAEIKIDDYVYYDNRVLKVGGPTALATYKGYAKKGSAKVIASNDSVLSKESIPAISETFLKEYVAANGECEVEMETTENYLHIQRKIPQWIPAIDPSGNLVLSIVKKWPVIPHTEEEKKALYEWANEPTEEQIQKQIAEAGMEHAKGCAKLGIESTLMSFLTGVRWARKNLL